MEVGLDGIMQGTSIGLGTQRLVAGGCMVMGEGIGLEEGIDIDTLHLLPAFIPS